MAGIDLRPLPHRDAIEFFTSKGYVPQLQWFHHLDLFRKEHVRNWVVAKAMRDDMAQTIREEMTRALSEGRMLEQFQAALAPRLQAMGWWGRQIMTDPVPPPRPRTMAPQPECQGKSLRPVHPASSRPKGGRAAGGLRGPRQFRPPGHRSSGNTFFPQRKADQRGSSERSGNSATHGA